MRARGRTRHRASWGTRILIAFGVVSVALALTTVVAGRADAAEPAPRTPCRSDVTWGVQSSLVTPAALPASIAWAYAQVAPVTGVTARAGDADTVRWYWIDTGSNTSAATGDYEDTESLLDDRPVWVHGHVPADSESAASVRQAVLRDVLRDAGVASPTSTGAGLSTADGRALTAQCARQATTAASPSVSPSAPSEPDADAAEIDTADEPATPRPTPVIPRTVVLPVVAAIEIGLVLLWLPSTRRFPARLTSGLSRIRRRSAR